MVSSLLLEKAMGEFPSGQRGQTVNLLALPSVVRIHLRPFTYLLRATVLARMRSDFSNEVCMKKEYAVVAELADARDLKSRG